MKAAVVDVGGGLRGIYAAGVLDYCMEKKIHFDAGVGVSAGSANIASYLAGQKGRNYVFYTEYSARKEYMSLRNFLFKKSYIDMDYVYGVLSNDNGENPLDYAVMAANPAQFIVVATNAETGKVQYFDKGDISQNNYDVIKASCSIPLYANPILLTVCRITMGLLEIRFPLKKPFPWDVIRSF